MRKKLKKAAMMTDIHFGKKSNSEQHNQDCINFISWFCEQVKNDPEIDHIVCLGDWHENRSALNISTLHYSYNGAKMLNSLGLPVFLIVGNHDLYYRHTRELHSLFHFESLSNFNIIKEPYVCEDTHEKTLFCPYMFHDEYPSLANYLNIPIWFGHFEFQGFVITGYNNVMMTGPNPFDFRGPKYIFSGHFHKRQIMDNIVYIGNTFPMDFGDAGDFSRGMAVYDYKKQTVDFIDWEQCPKYIKTNLSAMIENKVNFFPNARISCTADIPLSYEEINSIRQKFIEKYQLREFTIEDSSEISNLISHTETEIYDNELTNVFDMMIQLLNNIDSEHIDNNLLIEIYKSLKVNT